MSKKKVIICFIAWILCICVFVPMMLFVKQLHNVGFYSTESIESIKDQFKENALEQYSVYAASGYEQGYNMSYIDGNTNFKYGVIRADSIDNLDLSDKSIYEVENFDTDFDPDTDIDKIYSCNMNSSTTYSCPLDIWHTASVYNESYSEEYSMDIYRILYDKENNIYYADLGYCDIEGLYEDTLLAVKIAGDEVTYPDAQEISADYLTNNNYTIADEQGYVVEDNIVSFKAKHSYQNDSYYIISYISTPLDSSKNDLFVRGEKLINTFFPLKYLLIASLIALFVIGVISFIVMIKEIFVGLITTWQTNTSIILRWAILFIFLTLAEGAALVGFDNAYTILCILWFIEKIILFVLFISWVAQLNALTIYSDKLAAGNLDEHIESDKMHYDIKCIADNIAKIQDGIDIATNEKIKSERFKTDLIANVSHDIKTPLTSIISYVDLLTKEGADCENAQEYLGILSRQSEKLKKLIEDLIEASKASSGAINISMSAGDVGVLLTQIIGEYVEKLNEKNINLVTNVRSDLQTIEFDGQHLQRVIDNLMGNICKYSLPGTRAYVDAWQKDGKTYVTFKNISSESLNMTADELIERFTQGDKSRNTEGHGLGLAIASSLMQVMKGDLQIDIDGDLFKATIIL